MFRAVSVVIAALVLVSCSSVDRYSESTSTLFGMEIPQFTPADATALSGELADLEQMHGICFGWTLKDAGTGATSTGSSRGPAISARSCPRWAEADVVVGYTAESSEDADAADVTLLTSPDLSAAVGDAEFERLGVTPDALVDDPVAATGHAALAVPLLLVEAGALPAPPEPTAAQPLDPLAAAQAPQPGGGDFTAGQIAALVLSLLGAVALLGFGLVARQKDRMKGRR